MASRETYAVRITLPYVSMVGICTAWKDHCEQVIAYEHEGTRTHCHLLLINCKVTTQRLKQLSGREERGNTFWNFKTADDKWDKYITYMSKGKYEPFFMSNEHHYSWKDTDRLKRLWVPPEEAPVVRLKAGEAYKEFEKLVSLMPLEQRNDRTWIKVHAMNYLNARHTWHSPQFENELRGFVNTFNFRYRL